MAEATLTPLQQLSAAQAADPASRVMLMSKGEIAYFPLSVLTEQLNSIISLDTLKVADGLCLIGQILSFDDLRKLKPRSEGARISLRGWNTNTCYGGGEFIGHLTKGTDDGGTIAAGSGYYWERVCNDPAELNVTHWGAVPDGKTDAAPAMLNMYNWSFAKFQGVGIRFPAGTFFVSQFKPGKELNIIRITGNPTNFGYHGSTILVSDNNDNFMIDLTARKVELANFIFRGTTTVAAPTKKSIYSNNIAGGQYFNGTCLRFENIGGKSICLVDTLDTHLNQWYASGCTGDVITATWSGRAAGVWDHSTAIELSNFNVQNVRGAKVFNLPRCTQSFMYNGWIEHCDDPGDINNGQWVITGLSIEDCKAALRASYSRLVETARSLQSGSKIDYSIDPTIEEWLSEWERGRVDIQNYGVYTDGSIEFGAMMSRNKLSNSAASAKWFRVGKFFSPAEGDQIDVNLIGTGNFLSVGAVIENVDSVRQGGGNTLIRLQYKSKAIGATLMPFGSSPIQAALFVKDGSTFQLYVQLKPYTRNVIPVVTATGITHFEKGVSFYFRPDIAGLADAEIADLVGATVINEQWSIGQAAGVGVTNEGNLVLKGKIVNNHLAVQVMVSTAAYAKPEIRYLELKTEAK
ncbi:tail spike protein [Erwinia phage AH06]|nr:tail spike protein [Erwinia phage AH06]